MHDIKYVQMLIPYADWKKNMVYAINITLLVNKNLLERHLFKF